MDHWCLHITSQMPFIFYSFCDKMGKTREHVTKVRTGCANIYKSGQCENNILGIQDLSNAYDKNLLQGLFKHFKQVC